MSHARISPLVCAAAVVVCLGAAGPPAAAQELGGLPRKGGVPLEQLDGVEIRYGAVRAPDGARLRTVVTRPRGASGRLGGIFVTPWLSCDSVEAPPRAEPSDGTGLVLQAVAERSGLVLYRVDKHGVGDSEGVCEDTDFGTELAGMQAAFRDFARHEWVDPARLIVFGISNGGGYAPLVPNGRPVAGYISSGGWSKTWLEHMLEIERRRLVLSGFDHGVASERMRGYATFYDRYLNGRLTPGEVVRESPHLAPLWYDEPARQYGRPAAFYQQLQGLNLLAAWSAVDVPVLAMWGEYDWIMSRGDIELIAEVVNQNAPGGGRFVQIPRMGHSHQVFGSPADAFRFRDPGFDQTVVTTILDWLKSLR